MDYYIGHSYRYILLCFLLIISCSLKSQIEFEQHITHSNPGLAHSVNTVQTVDLDNDNDDILISSNYDGQIAWYENLDGRGTLSPLQIISSAMPTPLQLYTDDLDNDGDQDILCFRTCLTGSFSSYELSWFKNLDGHGLFSEEIHIGKSRSRHFPALIDMDKDGDLDILGGNDAGAYGWWENDLAQNNFGKFIELPSQYFDSSAVYHVIAEDIDLDGDDDLFIVGSRGLLYFEFLDINSGYSPPITLGPGYLTNDLKLTDLDGDGDLDIIQLASNNRKLLWFENEDGLGLFSEEKDFYTSDYRAFSLELYDVEGDGDLDVIAGSRNSGTIEWFENQGNGNYANPKIISEQEPKLLDIATIDLNGDHLMDILSALEFDSDLSLLSQEPGTGNFVRSTLTSPLLVIKDVTTIDWDADGDKDIMLSYESNNQLAWQENINGEGNFGPPVVISEFVEYVSVLTSFDMNTDNREDLFFGLDDHPFSGISNNLYWFFNNGQLNQYIKDGIQNVSQLVGADVDMDGDKDLVVSDHNSYTIKWIENIDGNYFDKVTEVANNSTGIWDFIVADLDNDSDLDIAAADANDDQLSIYMNLDSLGTYSQKEGHGRHFNLRNISAGDLMDDGDTDLLLSGGGSIILYENTDSLGNFKILTEITLIGVNDTDFADVDQDGDLDIVAITSRDSIYWFENTNDHGDFIKRPLDFHLVNPQKIIVDDLNGDGVPDLLTYTTNDKIIWYKNQGLNKNKIQSRVLLSTNLDTCATSNVQIEDLAITTVGGQESITTFSGLDYFVNHYIDDGSYTTSLTSVFPEHFKAVPVSYNSDFQDIGNIDTVIFCLEVVEAIDDLNITIVPLNEPRPGFISRFRVIYQNLGTSIRSGDITLSFDTVQLKPVRTAPIPTDSTAGLMVFNFEDLLPFETAFIDLSFKTALIPDIMLRDTITMKASITVSTDEISPEDNSFKLNNIVIGSYDPNDIRVLEGSYVQIVEVDDYLHYIIRFQNTGTASALNVVVTNTLDEQLDWRTFTIQSTSHPEITCITDSSYIEFKFEDINLPDSLTNEEASNGFICYKVKPLENTITGDIINNDAQIYFDFNPAILTNIVSTEYISGSATEDLKTETSFIFPNPTSAYLNINLPNHLNYSSTIYNIKGQVMNTSENQNKINVSDLSNGLYLIDVQIENSKRRMKEKFLISK